MSEVSINVFQDIREKISIFTIHDFKALNLFARIFIVLNQKDVHINCIFCKNLTKLMHTEHEKKMTSLCSTPMTTDEMRITFDRKEHRYLTQFLNVFHQN